jgi:hypothetical protein
MSCSKWKEQAESCENSDSLRSGHLRLQALTCSGAEVPRSWVWKICYDCKHMSKEGVNLGRIVISGTNTEPRTGVSVLLSEVEIRE